MSYRSLEKLQALIPRHTLFKHGFNLSPMYRRSTARVRSVSEDLKVVEIEIPLTWRNRNYVGTIFGGSMLSASDPIYMVQLINILGDAYVVWDKSVNVRFRRPGRSKLSGRFEYTADELDEIRREVSEHGELDWVKTFSLVDESGEVVVTGEKTLYVADKAFRRSKLKRR